MAREEEISFQSIDGTPLYGTLRMTPRPRLGVLMVHGMTADRDEDGLYSDLASGLDSLDAASLRFDFRAHGRSGGRCEDLTLSGVINDVDSACRALSSSLPPGAPAAAVASSFGGGLCAHWASENPGRLAGLVLLNPLLDYAKRMLFDKPFWRGRSLDGKAAEDLRVRGWLEHGRFRMGRPLINELLLIRPHESIRDLKIPLLTMHGDADSMVPHDVSKKCTQECARSEFVTVRGADHGFARPGDEDLDHPDTLRFRGEVLARTLEWLRGI